MINLLIWQVFWLALFSDAFPSVCTDSGEVSENFSVKAYSCGYSSGFAPDSLFIPGKKAAGTKFRDKCRNIFKHKDTKSRRKKRRQQT